MFDVVLKTPIGHVGIQCEQSKLKSIQFLEQHIVPIPYQTLSDKVRKIAKSIEDFFANPQNISTIPHQLQGTPFQKKVWQALRKIPLGQTKTYGELAQELDTAPRAIGMACRHNPIPLVIPCHRVVAANSLGGFCGHTDGNKVAIKQWLLAHERGILESL